MRDVPHQIPPVQGAQRSIGTRNYSAGEGGPAEGRPLLLLLCSSLIPPPPSSPLPPFSSSSLLPSLPFYPLLHSPSLSSPSGSFQQSGDLHHLLIIINIQIQGDCLVQEGVTYSTISSMDAHGLEGPWSFQRDLKIILEIKVGKVDPQQPKELRPQLS